MVLHLSRKRDNLSYNAKDGNRLFSPEVEPRARTLGIDKSKVDQKVAEWSQEFVEEAWFGI